MAVYRADGIVMHLPVERTFSDEIPDRILFVCMDLDSGAADSADCMGCRRIFMRIMEKKNSYESYGNGDLAGNRVLKRQSGIGMDERADRTDPCHGCDDTTESRNVTLGDAGKPYGIPADGERRRQLYSVAPKEIMAAARAYSAEIYPVYGRSIWDASLGSYSYDTYATGQEDLYLWMSHLEATGETEYVRMDESTGARTIDFADCLKYAAEKNVDIILLPGNLRKETLSELQNTAGSKLQPLDGYYLLTMQK